MGKKDKSMSETAMRDADDTPVFVRDDGSYAESFPAENIVRRADSEETKFKVYGFVGDHGDFEEVEWDYDTEEDALFHATHIYGRTDVTAFSRDGEVFEVEVHEVDVDE